MRCGTRIGMVSCTSKVPTRNRDCTSIDVGAVGHMIIELLHLFVCLFVTAIDMQFAVQHAGNREAVIMRF